MPDDDNDGRVDPGKACRLDSDDDATREGSIDATNTPRSSMPARPNASYFIYN